MPDAAALTSFDYLKRVLTARVYDVAIESPLEKARNLSQRLGCEVLLKREDQQPVFSFKLRGAYNKMAHLTPGQLEKGVICASAGNHARWQALWWTKRMKGSDLSRCSIHLMALSVMTSVQYSFSTERVPSSWMNVGL